MPAYFSVEIAFDTISRKSLVRDLFDLLAKNNVFYLRGCWMGKGYSQEQLMIVNQDYVSNFDSDDGSYYQSLFQFLDFTEVRGYWHATRDRVTFTLTIPEEDFYQYSQENDVIRCEDKMNAVKELCVRIWCMPAIRCIQTSWECSDSAAEYNYLSPLHSPQTEPFSIISISKYSAQWALNAMPIENNGVLFEIQDNWRWC